MANYHFTIKVDRKPDKTAISAASHADYINRDGSFANIDFKRELDTQVRSGCLLAPADKNVCPKDSTMPRANLSKADTFTEASTAA